MHDSGAEVAALPGAALWLSLVSPSQGARIDRDVVDRALGALAAAVVCRPAMDARR